MKQQILFLMLLLFTLSATAHEEFWWHAYAYDADRMDTLDINRVDSLLRVIPKDEQWLHNKVDQMHWYFAHDLPDVASMAFVKCMRLLADGEINTKHHAYWYYGLLNLYVEKTTNRLEFAGALNQIIKRRSIPIPDGPCLPCMAIDFNYLKLMAKSSRFVTDTQYESIVDLFNDAYKLKYYEILGNLAGYLIHASDNNISHRMKDMTVSVPRLVAELPPRPKARVLLDLAPMVEVVGIDSVKRFWRSYIALGSSKNLFALFRGHIELGILFEEIGQFDSARHHYNTALMHALRSQDLEAEVHVLSILSRLQQRDPETVFPDSLATRLGYLKELQVNSAAALTIKLNDILIRDLNESNRRLASLNRIILFLLVGVGILLLGLSWLLWRLFQQRKALQQANANKTMLYGMIAHDLRAPLSGFKSVLQKDLPPEEKEQQLNRVVNRLQWLLDDLLKWTFSQQQQLKVQAETFDLVEVVEENLDYFQFLLSDKKIQLSITLPEELPTEADQDMVSTLLRNILQNAIKHNTINGAIQIDGTLEEDGPLLTFSNTVVDKKSSMHPSLGHQLIETFAKANHIQLATQWNGADYAVRLQFPAPKG